MQNKSDYRATQGGKYKHKIDELGLKSLSGKKRDDTENIL